MTAPFVTIKPGMASNGLAFQDIFIDHEGRRFYSRSYLVVADTPHARAQEGQEFLRRLKRFPSEVLANDAYAKTQERVDHAMSERDNLIQFAKSGGPTTPPRPKLTVVGKEQSC